MKVELTLKGQRVWVKTPYSPILVDRFKMLPGYKFEGKQHDNAWSFPAVKDVILMLCEPLGMLRESLPPELREIVGPSPVAKPEVLDMGLLAGSRWLTPPMDHQRKNLVRTLQNNRWLLADEQGTGKSHAICNRLLRFVTGFRCLILCPKSCCIGWSDDHLRKHSELDSWVVDGTPEQRRAILQNGEGIYIANYEAVLHTPEFLKINWSMVVLDEIQKIKNFTSATAKAVRKLTDKAAYVYGLSGTPAPNGLQDWLGIIAAIRPDLAPKSERGEITKGAFESRFILKRRMNDDGPWLVAGYRNVEELQGIIQQFTSRVTKAECLDLPGEVFLERRVPLEGEQGRIYRTLKREAVARLTALGKTITVRNILTEGMRLLQIVGGFVTDDDRQMQELHPKAKILALDEVIEEVGTKQVVVWCHFREEVRFIAERLKAFGEVVWFTGQSLIKDRNDAIEAFRQGDARYFVATAASGGTGVNGLQAANVQVYYSRDYNYATYAQSRARLDRYGQTNRVSVYKLMGANTIDEKIDAALENKGDLQELLLKRPEELF